MNIQAKAVAAVVGVAIAAATAITIAALMRAARRGQPEDDPWGGPLRFRYTSPFRAFAFFMAFGIPLILTAMVVFLPRKQGDLWPILGTYLLFAALGLPLWWEATRYAILVSPEGLDCRSPWRGAQFIPWGEVRRFSYCSKNMWFIIEPEARRRFHVSVLVSGISQFLEQCEQHLPPSSLVGARMGYDQVGRAFPD